jgi:ubiquinone/menaquinone biosynthesis C-methylase UbiE
MSTKMVAPTQPRSARPTPRSSPNQASTQQKYSSNNPLARYANQRFFRALDSLAGRATASTILDAGCGEGVVLNRLSNHPAQRIFGLDLDPARLLLTRSRLPGQALIVGDIHNLPFSSASFDLVLALEVFEHIGDPDQALREVFRVSRQFLLASVPNEPWWRIGNMLRFKYLRHFGNTPEHIQHWSARGFRKFVSHHFSVAALKTPFLWTFALAQKHS